MVADVQVTVGVFGKLKKNKTTFSIWKKLLYFYVSCLEQIIRCSYALEFLKNGNPIDFVIFMLLRARSVANFCLMALL